MAKIAVEQLVTTPASLNYLRESSYDKTKWNLWKGLIFNNWWTPVDKYIAPDFGIIRPMEESTPFAVTKVYAIDFSDNITYIFGVENLATAVATRRVWLWERNRKTGARTWKWFITMTLATATAHTVRDFKIDRKIESTGLIGVSGTTVTGVWTQFAVNKVAVGARIGFGSTDPEAITTWYRITARTSDTALTLNVTPWTISAWTAYVIEEYRPVYIATNATTTNGGIHYGKGISIEDFIPAWTTIALAVSTDDQKAMYWLKDAATQTNIVAAWCACDFASATPTSLDTYVLDLVSAGNYKIFKYNIRAALTVATWASVSAFILATGNQTITGTGSQNTNLCIATAWHGNGSWVKCLYCVSTTRFMRIPVSWVLSLSTTFIADMIAEVTPWWSGTYWLTNALNTIEYIPSIDSFIIGTTWGNVHYVTQYVASWQQFQNMFGRNFMYFEQSTKDNNAPSIFSNQATSFSFNDAGWNMVYAVKQWTTASTAHIYCMAIGSDWQFAASNQWRLISPEIATPNCNKFDTIFANTVRYLWNNNLWKTTEPFKLYVRTTNINTDATSGWILVDKTNDISWLWWASSIQVAIEFKTMWESCLPARTLWLLIVYDDNSTDSHYQPCADLSDKTNKRFAWRFSTAFGWTVPTLRVRLYDAVTGWLLVDDVTAWSTGTWEKSTDWTTWGLYNTTDKANNTTFIRYTPASLADNIQVRALLTLN